MVAGLNGASLNQGKSYQFADRESVGELCDPANLFALLRHTATVRASVNLGKGLIHCDAHKFLGFWKFSQFLHRSLAQEVLLRPVDSPVHAGFKGRGLVDIRDQVESRFRSKGIRHHIKFVDLLCSKGRSGLLQRYLDFGVILYIAVDLIAILAGIAALCDFHSHIVDVVFHDLETL